jgi:hypothetical protein
MNDIQFSQALILLMKGVVYAEDNPAVWESILHFQARLREYLGYLNLRLIIAQDEGYAWLTNRPEQGEQNEEVAHLPKLISTRELSYPVSLLLVLFRQKLLEHDATDASSALVVSKEEVAELLKVFFKESGNETKYMRQLETHLNKIIELGFIRRLRNSTNKFEIKRIIASFIDADWLNALDAKLQEYLEYGLLKRDDANDLS